MSNHASDHAITEEVISAARENVNGWVYKIEGTYSSTEYVPPEAIVGAWKVNEKGDLTGDFFPNPRYKSSAEK